MKKDDYMEAKKWVKISKKLRKTYKNYEDLREHSIKLFGKQYFGIDEVPSQDLLVIRPNHIVEGGLAGHSNLGNTEPFYQRQKNGSYKVFNSKEMVEKLTPLLAEHVDREALIKDVLAHQTPKSLVELHERMVDIPKKSKKQPSVKQKPGCSYLSIGGKPGTPQVLMLRD